MSGAGVYADAARQTESIVCREWHRGGQSAVRRVGEAWGGGARVGCEWAVGRSDTPRCLVRGSLHRRHTPPPTAAAGPGADQWAFTFARVN